jgi:hypothetical protein
LRGTPSVILKCRPKEHYKYSSISYSLNLLIILMALLMLSPLTTTDVLLILALLSSSYMPWSMQGLNPKSSALMMRVSQ